MPITDGIAISASGEFEGYEIFIKYLPKTTTEDQLSSFFHECGSIIGEPQQSPSASHCRHHHQMPIPPNGS